MEVCPDDGARLIETELEDQGDPLLGAVFDGRFQITEKLGEGGMGAVYSARRLDFETEVALKLLKLDFAQDDGIRKRFMYEARVISNLKHPHAIRLFDFGQTDDGHVYMVMELLKGESLADRLGYRFVTYREVFDIIPPICGVLGEAHLRDVIHRDLKPENIYLLEVEGNEEFPKLLDFGIAKHKREATMTKSGTLWGTPAYMSPEQARGDMVGPSADVYAIGIMVFELISGNLPFHASTQMGYAVKHINEPPRPLSSIPGLRSVPQDLDDYVLRMLSKDPEKRPESMQEVASTLERIRDEHFDEELLESVPAEEIDPIGLQRWMQEAPDVSQEMKVGPSNGAGGEANTVVVDDAGLTAQRDGEKARAMADTAAIGEMDTQALEEIADAQLASRPTADEQSTQRVHELGEGASQVTGDEQLSSAPEGEELRTKKPPIWALALGALVVAVGLITGASVLTLDVDRDADRPVAQEEPEEVDERVTAEAVGSGEARAMATTHALSVIVEAHTMARRIDGEEGGEVFGEEFDFIYDVPADEDAEADDRSKTLREALEKTF